MEMVEITPQPFFPIQTATELHTFTIKLDKLVIYGHQNQAQSKNKEMYSCKDIFL